MSFHHPQANPYTPMLNGQLFPLQFQNRDGTTANMQYLRNGIQIPRRKSQIDRQPTTTNKQSDEYKASIGVFAAFLLGFIVLFSIVCIGIYGLRNRAIYEEIVDYLDKTISISKINYNHRIGVYALSKDELAQLSNLRQYKAIIWTFFFMELGAYIAISATIVFFYLTNVNRNRILTLIFWILFGAAFVYTIAESHLFSFLLLPYVHTMPNATEHLLKHAKPHNPGGLQQMEQRIDCSFDYNLYAPVGEFSLKNTCDPAIRNSFLPATLIWLLLVLRILPAIIFVVFVVFWRDYGGQLIANLIQHTRPKMASSTTTQKHKQQQQPTTKSTNIFKTKSNNKSAQAKSNTVTDSKIMPTTSNLTTIGNTLDHAPKVIRDPSISSTQISYNNNGYWGGTNGSSRSSDISRFADDFGRPSLVGGPGRNSVVSEV